VRLDSPEALRDWFAERGWIGEGERLTQADLRQAHEVREAIRSLLLANNGYPLDEQAVESLNSAAARAEVLVRFDTAGAGDLAPARSGIDGALGHLLAVVFRSMAEGTWPRFKACPYDGCHWAFYDYSKNRSGTWCDMAVCGNRAKAQAYRERRAKRR
jgi:predicted RNA-binding Zn ribbon-like protein